METEELQNKMRGLLKKSRGKKLQVLKASTKNIPRLLTGENLQNSMSNDWDDILELRSHILNSIQEKPIDEVANDDDSELQELEEKMEKNRTLIKDLKQNEMNRISREFIANNYEKRFGVPQKTVILALIGENGSKTEFERQIKIKKRVHTTT